MEENAKLHALLLAQQRIIDEQAQHIRFLEAYPYCQQCERDKVCIYKGALYLQAEPLLREDFLNVVLDIVPQNNGIQVQRVDSDSPTGSISEFIGFNTRFENRRGDTDIFVVAYWLCHPQLRSLEFANRNVHPTTRYAMHLTIHHPQRSAADYEPDYVAFNVCPHSATLTIKTLYAFAADWRESHQKSS